MLPKSFWEKDILGNETFYPPSTCRYRISLTAFYNTHVNLRTYIPGPSKTMFYLLKECSVMF